MEAADQNQLNGILLGYWSDEIEWILELTNLTEVQLAIQENRLVTFEKVKAFRHMLVLKFHTDKSKDQDTAKIVLINEVWPKIAERASARARWQALFSPASQPAEKVRGGGQM